MNKLHHRKAIIDDLPTIVTLLLDNVLGHNREASPEKTDKPYIDAFFRIDMGLN